jgi:hypothetical protein
MAEKSSWDQANRQQKHGLVWRNRKNISQIIKDYFCLPFFLLIILCAGWSKLDFAERDKCRPVLLRLSLARNLEIPVMSLYGTGWRERGFRLWVIEY